MAYLIINQKNKELDSNLIKVVNLVLQQVINEKIPLQKVFKGFKNIDEILNHPEVVVKGFEKDSKLGVEDIKDIQEKMQYKPMSLPKQIAIIFNSEKMTTEAQNAMLKTLEEHSENCEYFLIINNEQNLLSTIQSRCQKIYTETFLSSSDSNEIFTKPNTTPDENENLFDIELFISSDLTTQFNKIEEIIENEKEDGESIQIFLESLAKYYRNILNNLITSNNSNSDNTYKKDLINIIQAINTAKIRLEANTSKKLLLENLILQIKSYS